MERRAPGRTGQDAGSYQATSPLARASSWIGGSVNELATQLQMARPTVDRYLDLLEETFVIFRLPAFSTNPARRSARATRSSSGIPGSGTLCSMRSQIDEVRPDISSLRESWVIAEVAKRNALLGSPAELYFWRTRSHSEVDLVIKNMMEQLGVNALAGIRNLRACL